ncbi:hypothetical protein ACR79Q_09905 [Sphingobacterium multivorum]|uniref:hypothetical protein n=1 Tax=Sphingobacterium multivorum TaxID=28454 RepID=UPI003DA56B97
MKKLIKKAIQDENPHATKVMTKTINNVAGEKEKFSLYSAELSDGYVAAFGVPHKEIGEINSQLLKLAFLVHSQKFTFKRIFRCINNLFDNHCRRFSVQSF